MMLSGSVDVTKEPLYLTVFHMADGLPGAPPNLTQAFAARSTQVEAIAQALRLDTPDEYLNNVGPAMGIAAETIWDAKNECVLHGGVAWRTMLAGWRGPYNLDALGNHDRAVQDIRHWLKRQNLTPVTTGDPAIGPWDANMPHARKEAMLHSNGDVSNNHYDMNMVFFDALPAPPALDRRPGVRPRDMARLPAPSGLGASALSPHLHQRGGKQPAALRGVCRYLGQRQPAVQRRRRGALLCVQRVRLSYSGQAGTRTGPGRSSLRR